MRMIAMQTCSLLKVRSFERQSHSTLYLTVRGVEPVVTHQAFWLESTGVKAKFAPFSSHVQ